MELAIFLGFAVIILGMVAGAVVLAIYDHPFLAFLLGFAAFVCLFALYGLSMTMLGTPPHVEVI